MTADQSPHEVTLDVGPVAHGGHCVARLGEPGGQVVVFVRHALPGERVRAVVTERRKRYWRADAVEILDPSPDRVPPPCPFAGPGRCGGCDFQHVSAEGQRRLKAAVVREQLVRLGGVAAEDVADLVVEALPGGPLGWRTRVQYAVDRQGRVGFRRHRSHDVLPVDRCVIAAPAIQDTDVTSRRWRGVGGVSAVAGSGGDVTIATWRHVAHRRSGTWRHVAGPEVVYEEAVGRTWELSPGAFWQVHPAAADTFAAAVREALAPRPGDVAWDLYGGAGLFAAALAPAVGADGSVTVVDNDPRATSAGLAGAGNLGDLPQVSVVHGRVDDVLGQLAAPDIVVLDPPRTGAGAEVVGGVIAAAPRAVAYVACDPAALARDVRTFREAGWRLAGLRAFDAFPMTHHVECVALLTPVTD